jgi:diadenylate cyclase
MNYMTSLFRDFSWVDGLDILLVAFVMYFVLVLLREVQGIRILIGFGVLFMVGVVCEPFPSHHHRMAGHQPLAGDHDRARGAFSARPPPPAQPRGAGRMVGERFSGARRCVSTSHQGGAGFGEGQVRCFDRLGTQRTPWKPSLESGTRLDAEVSSDLLVTLFTPGTPLHDGAVVIRNGRVIAAGCILPLVAKPEPQPILRHEAPGRSGVDGRNRRVGGGGVGGNQQRVARHVGENHAEDRRGNSGRNADAVRLADFLGGPTKGMGAAG